MKRNRVQAIKLGEKPRRPAKPGNIRAPLDHPPGGEWTFLPLPQKDGVLMNAPLLPSSIIETRNDEDNGS
jgi:hypothetical protein